MNKIQLLKEELTRGDLAPSLAPREISFLRINPRLVLGWVFPYLSYKMQRLIKMSLQKLLKKYSYPALEKQY